MISDDDARRVVRNVVRQATEKAGSQTALATQIGASQASVSKWTSGASQPAGKYLIAMLVLLGYNGTEG